jgi:predicted SprT family Zn-dependent metalloprotease
MAKRGARTLTSDEYSAFEAAYDWFNAELFDRQLPPCLITLQRKVRSRGYFANDRFEHRAEGSTTDEIALNPDTFRGRSDKDILSTLVHEMVHCWQRHFGKVGRAGYHNKEWAAHMVLIGLMPTDTGEAGGKTTGQRMTHYIMAGEAFDRVADALLATGFQLNWQSHALHAAEAKRKAASKTKYTCPGCGQNAWAKPDASLVCGECGETMEGEQ